LKKFIGKIYSLRIFRLEKCPFEVLALVFGHEGSSFKLVIPGNKVKEVFKISFQLRSISKLVITEIRDK